MVIQMFHLALISHSYWVPMYLDDPVELLLNLLHHPHDPQVSQVTRHLEPISHGLKVLLLGTMQTMACLWMICNAQVNESPPVGNNADNGLPRMICNAQVNESPPVGNNADNGLPRMICNAQVNESPPVGNNADNGLPLNDMQCSGKWKSSSREQWCPHLETA